MPQALVLPCHRFESPGLLANMFNLVDRLLSRRKKLVISLMETFVVVDNLLIAVYQRCV